MAELSIGSSKASLDAYYAVRATVSRVLVINAQQGAETVEGLRGFDVRPTIAVTHAHIELPAEHPAEHVGGARLALAALGLRRVWCVMREM